MRLNAQRLGLLILSFALVSITVVACAAPQPTVTTSSGGANNNVFHTPNPGLNSPTPTFPGFTIGTWPSQYSPGNNDTLTIYVLCRIQDPTMQNPATPAVGVTVLVDFTPAVLPQATPIPYSQPPFTGTTGKDGIAAFTFQLNDPYSGTPIRIQASANYHGETYTAQNFFTPNPAAKPSPSPSGSPTPTGTVGTGG